MKLFWKIYNYYIRRKIFIEQCSWTRDQWEQHEEQQEEYKELMINNRYITQEYIRNM